MRQLKYLFAAAVLFAVFAAAVLFATMLPKVAQDAGNPAAVQASAGPVPPGVPLRQPWQWPPGVHALGQ